MDPFTNLTTPCGGAAAATTVPAAEIRRREAKRAEDEAQSRWMQLFVYRGSAMFKKAFHRSLHDPAQAAEVAESALAYFRNSMVSREEFEEISRECQQGGKK
jgi:hypothetical protein